jgi:hypothetical protein
MVFFRSKQTRFLLLYLVAAGIAIKHEIQEGFRCSQEEMEGNVFIEG